MVNVVTKGVGSTLTRDGLGVTDGRLEQWMVQTHERVDRFVPGSGDIDGGGGFGEIDEQMVLLEGPMYQTQIGGFVRLHFGAKIRPPGAVDVPIRCRRIRGHVDTVVETNDSEIVKPLSEVVFPELSDLFHLFQEILLVGRLEEPILYHVVVERS